MARHCGIILCVAVFLVAALLPVSPLRAEDEDLDSTVYIVFDPETGELITVEEPSGKKKPHTSMNAAPPQDTQDPADDATDSEPTPLLLGGAVALGLIGGAIAWIRKSRKSP